MNLKSNTNNLESSSQIKLNNSFSRYSKPLSWWVKIHTRSPLCTYMFGPFDTRMEARLLQDGYVEDLQLENALGISVELRQGNPQYLTICDATYY